MWRHRFVRICNPAAAVPAGGVGRQECVGCEMWSRLNMVRTCAAAGASERSAGFVRDAPARGPILVLLLIPLISLRGFVFYRGTAFSRMSSPEVEPRFAVLPKTSGSSFGFWQR